MADALQALGAAGGRVQDPNAPEGYVSQGLIQRGAEGLAGSATVGSLGTSAPRNALRAGLSRNGAKNALDPSVSARAQRALDMGFEDMAHYRGMGAAYDPETAATKPQWFSSRADVANSYTEPAYVLREAPQVMPAYIRPGKMVEIDAGGVGWDQIPFSAIPPEYQSVIPTAYTKTGKTKATTDSIVRWLEREVGPDTVRFRNVLDHAAEEPIPSDVTVVLNPANIRSTQAMFDPARINETDPLAANPLAGALITPEAGAQPQGPTISDMGGRPIPPEEEAQRQALIRYLQGGN